jgi:myo-inositol-1(or 4)-monophosphatase
MTIETDLARIEAALAAGAEAAAPFTPGSVDYVFKEGDDPLTAADTAVDDVLRSILPVRGEGWLSEETADDASRLDKSRVWVVDPIDGTREFVAGIPEWCISIALVEDGRPVAGGVHNPATGETMVGAAARGVEYRGPHERRRAATLAGHQVLASRSEVKRGEWERFAGRGFDVVPMGSVAFKLARVAAGLAAATWTLVPKHEWDVAAGAALVLAAGGEVRTLEGETPVFNQPSPKLSGFIAAGPGLLPEVLAEITAAREHDSSR